MKCLRIGLLAAFFALAAGGRAAPAQDQATTAPSQATRRPKIGLALGGGGARGAAHVGVLRVLEKLHIPIDYIAGTSMGSVVGGLYAVGYSPDELEKIISNVDWANLFVDNAPRRDTVFRAKENEYLVPPGATLGIAHGLTLPAGLIAGRKLGFLLNTLTLPAANVSNFDRLSIPFRAVATDARTGEVVVLGHGSLPTAIRSSMAIPVVFTPVTFEGRSLIDGGTSQNLPVQTCRAMGADIVIAVDVASSSEVPKEAPKSVADMLGRLIDLPLLRNTMESRPLADLVITPDLKGLSSGDFAKALEIIPKGDVAAKAESAKLSQWSVSAEEYAAWQKDRRKPLPKERPVLDAVVVDPIPGFDTRRITRVIATKAGLPFNERVLQADMRRISGMALWQNVEFRLETTEDGKNILHIIATPKSWGPTYVSAGIDFEINASRADADWNLSMLVDATELNRIGADWKAGLRLGTEIGLASKFYQPLDYASRFFVAPTLFFDQQKIEVFANEVDVASYRVRQGYAGLDLGLQLGHLLSLGQFSVGVDRGIQKAERIVGLEEFPDVNADTGGFHSELVLDQLDNFWFPREGWFVDLVYNGNRTSFGADTDFNRAQLQAAAAHSIGRWVVLGRIGYGDSFGSPLPLGSLFSLGGFRNLSGRPKGQLIGNTMAIGVLAIRYRLTAQPGTIVKGLYVGATAELGNVWASRKDASIDNMHGAWSVYLTTDTLLGPLYLAYGNSGNKNTAVYLFLNRGF